jgi:hypothetical protein
MFDVYRAAPVACESKPDQPAKPSHQSSTRAVQAITSLRSCQGRGAHPHEVSLTVPFYHPLIASFMSRSVHHAPGVKPELHPAPEPDGRAVWMTIDGTDSTPLHNIINL